jgi:hypothetical protein
MRYLFGFLCVCALGVMPLVGCGDTNVTVYCGTDDTSSGHLFPCTEQGIRDAIAAGGGPQVFDCAGAQTVVTQAEIEINNDVVLDGEGNLAVDGNSSHLVFAVAEGVTAELRDFVVTNGDRGILNAGTLTVTSSTVSGNACDCVGGGIRNEGLLTLTNSTLSGNNAAEGGGIHNASGATAILTSSTLSGNGASRGGGIFNEGMATVTNSTMSGNTDDGISNDGTMMLINSTVDGYQTPLVGISSDGTLTVVNSLIVSDCVGDIVSGGYNIESAGDSCGFDQVTDLVNVSEEDLMLAPFADNGGSTETRALLPGSVAIDRIPEDRCVDADGEPLTTDQRGEPRPETGGTMCDVGAFEVQPTPVEGCIQSGGTVSTGLCCQAVESFPNTCTTGACGCAPDASHEVDVCICPANTCFDGESCVAQ